MLSTGLRIHTKVNHQKLEKKIIAAIKAIDNMQGYTDLLILFASYFGAVEKLVDESINLSCVPDYLQRRKVAALTADMNFLNTQLIPHAVPIILPDIENNLQCMGAMYVMEGSSLGGATIANLIASKTKLSTEGGLAFFNGYGANTIPMWQTFKNQLDSIVLNPGDEYVVIHSANQTFARFSDWIDLCNTN
jgi:heme oxygenase